MSAYVLVTGVVYRSPQQRTGKPFVTATLLLRSIAFADAAQAELLRLGVGDAVSIQGPLRGGRTRLALSRSRCLRSASQRAKTGKMDPVAAGRDQAKPLSCPAAAIPEFDDAIPL